MSQSGILEVDGFCPICETETHFSAESAWLRDYFICLKCRSAPRERALMTVLNMYFPRWRELTIHESSPALRASAKLQRECPRYVPTQYDPQIGFGSVHRQFGYRSEDLEAQTFPDGKFDLVITQDVFKHLFRPDRAIAEIARTLKPGGAHVCTVPIGRKDAPSVRRARRKDDGSIEHLMEPIYHGNPIDESGSLVTIDYGYDIADYFDVHGDLNTTLCYIDDLTKGIRAELIEVLVSRKPARASDIDLVESSAGPKTRRRSALNIARAAWSRLGRPRDA